MLGLFYLVLLLVIFLDLQCLGSSQANDGKIGGGGGEVKVVFRDVTSTYNFLKDIFLKPHKMI